MTFAALLNQPITVERRGVTGTDAYRSEVLGTVTTYTTVGYLEQTAAVEVIVDRETYTSEWLLVLPSGSFIDANDRVVYGGVTYEVIGPPHRVWNPRIASEHHVEARLKATSG